MLKHFGSSDLHALPHAPCKAVVEMVLTMRRERFLLWDPYQARVWLPGPTHPTDIWFYSHSWCSEIMFF